MRAIAADAVAWSVCLRVWVLVTITSPAKTDEPIRRCHLAADWREPKQERPQDFG